MTVTIDGTARIERVRFENLSGTFAGDPSANYSWLYVTSGSSPHGGLYLEKEGGAIIGPFITGSATTWQLNFWAVNNEPPLISYATLDTRNSRPVLDFNVTGSIAIFTDAMPAEYANGGVDLEIWFSTTETGTSGNAYYSVALERIVAETTDIDSDNFATAINGSAAVPPGKTVKTGTLSLTNGVQMDSVVAEDYFRLKFILISGTFSGDLELHYIEMRES